VEPIAPHPRTSAAAGASGPLLPPELPWLYVLIPLPAAYLMGHDLLEQAWPLLLRSLLKMYLPFAVFGLAFHLLYHYVMPHLLGRVRGRPRGWRCTSARWLCSRRLSLRPSCLWLR
jgi:hypothetical protein